MTLWQWQGSSYSFQRGRSFATISGFQGEVLVEILDFPIHSIHFHFSLSSRQGEVSQFRETFSPKSPSRMTPEWIGVPGKMGIKKLFLCPHIGWCQRHIQGWETSGLIKISGLRTFNLSIKCYFYTCSQDYPFTCMSKVVLLVWIYMS